MKKLFVAVALVMGLGTSVAFAENFHASVDSVTIVNEFKPIEVKRSSTKLFWMQLQKTMLNLPSKKHT